VPPRTAAPPRAAPPRAAPPRAATWTIRFPSAASSFSSAARRLTRPFGKTEIGPLIAGGAKKSAIPNPAMANFVLSFIVSSLDDFDLCAVASTAVWPCLWWLAHQLELAGPPGCAISPLVMLDEVIITRMQCSGNCPLVRAPLADPLRALADRTG
jgi:hypothetical protein